MESSSNKKEHKSVSEMVLLLNGEEERNRVPVRAVSFFFLKQGIRLHLGTQHNYSNVMNSLSDDTL